MSTGIHQMNARSWETLVKFMLKVNLIISTGPILYQEINFIRQQENNTILNSAVDEIFLHENQKVSTMRKEPENVKSDFDDSKLYWIKKLSLEYTKEKL